MSIVTAPAVNAKCRAMHSRLLGNADYDALLRRPGVPQIAEYLKKETPYAHVLSRLNENDVHRGQLERLFMRSLFHDYEKLLGFSGGSSGGGGSKEAIRAMFEEHEVSDLKLVISSICSDHENLLTAGDLYYVSQYSSFGADALLEAATMEQLVENLKGTRYHDVLLPFAAAGKPDFFKIDCALDLLSHRAKLAAFGKRLKGSAREACMDIYGQQVDIANIQTIYRMKKLFNYPSATTIAGLIPYRHRLGGRDLVAMADSGSVGALVEVVSRTWYRPMFPPGEESSWETLHAERFYRMHHANMRRHGSDATTALSYLHMKEVEIKNIIMILEGVRYSLPTRQIRSFLVGGRAAHGDQQ